MEIGNQDYSFNELAIESNATINYLHFEEFFVLARVIKITMRGVNVRVEHKRVYVHHSHVVTIAGLK